MESLLTNAATYVEVLSNCSSAKVAHWKQEDLQRAINWAEYFKRVQGRIQKKPAVVKKFDSQLKEISLATGSQFGAQTTSVAFLGESLDYLLKILLENPHLPENITKLILQTHGSEDHLQYVEKIVRGQSLLGTLMVIHSKLTANLPTHAPASLRSDPVLMADAGLLLEEMKHLISQTHPPHHLIHTRLGQLARQENGMEVVLLSLSGPSHLVATVEQPSSSTAASTSSVILAWLEQNIQTTPPNQKLTQATDSSDESREESVSNRFWSLSPDTLAIVSAQSVGFFRFLYKMLTSRVDQLQAKLMERESGPEEGEREKTERPEGVCPERFEREVLCYFRSLLAVDERVREVTVSLVESQVQETAARVLAAGMASQSEPTSLTIHGESSGQFPTPVSALKLPVNLWRKVLALADAE